MNSIHDVTSKKLTTFVVNCRMRYFKSKKDECTKCTFRSRKLSPHLDDFSGAKKTHHSLNNRLDPRRKHTTIGAHRNVVGQRKLGRTNALFCGLFHGATLMTISVHLAPVFSNGKRGWERDFFC